LSAGEICGRGVRSGDDGPGWDRGRGELRGQVGVGVTEEGLRSTFAVQFQGYCGPTKPEWVDDSMVDKMVERMMGDEKAERERAEEVMSDKIQAALKGGYTLQEREVSPEEFAQIAEEAKAKAEAEASLLAEEEE